ncbi:SH3 domain-containing protein [Dyadobacter sp. LHD-138]|uniref:SH3 domain-containing protein n=1 Tax=Dyadobacter sp. LHD-138 TaxID=3071413 RepID=UPI0027E12686|nr:SH3 domain-containing protein [Dyadobacter sp. LHD-138]MDQ6479997.1 SH3 domain-containing protein [Dyadobacter sp. LHD-138]
MKIHYIALFCSLFAWSCASNSNQESPAEATPVEAEQPKEELFGIKKDELFLRKEPSLKGQKIVNQKATEALRETHYISVDKSVKVKILEKEKGWVKIQVMEPDWLQYTHIGWIEDKYLGSFDEINPKRSAPVKLSAFANIEPLRQSLSGNGIGQLHPWKHVDGGDWQSITDYFEIGREANQYGLRNNLAYYLSSPEEGFIETLQLVLNVNEPREREFAHEKLKETIRKTFKSLAEPIPAGLLKAVDREVHFTSKDEKMIVTMKPEKSRIMTLILEVKTK